MTQIILNKELPHIHIKELILRDRIDFEITLLIASVTIAGDKVYD
jgi:hypothetical protein